MNKNFICPYCEENLPIINNISRCPICVEKLPDDLIKNIQDSYVAENKNNEAQKLDAEQINCLYCNEVISSRAKKCKHCGEFLNKNFLNNSESKISDSNRDMSFLVCIKRGFTSLLDFKGRSTRKEYWSYLFFAIILLKIFEKILIEIVYGLENIMLVSFIFMILSFVFTITIKIRRMRDVSNNVFVIYLPIIAFLVGFCISFVGWFLGNLAIIRFASIIELIMGLIISIIALFPSKK